MQKLRIYDVALAMAGEAAVIGRRIERFDRDLARQVRRSSTAVPLNVAEGMCARGANKQARYQTAMAEANETVAAVQVAKVAGYLEEVDVTKLLDRLDHITAVMWKLTH